MECPGSRPNEKCRPLPIGCRKCTRQQTRTTAQSCSPCGRILSGTHGYLFPYYWVQDCSFLSSRVRMSRICLSPSELLGARKSPFEMRLEPAVAVSHVS